MTSSVPLDQERLCEQLTLWHELTSSSSDLDQPNPYPYPTVQRNNFILSPEYRDEIRILDTIAASLTTGEPGDVVAAALDKSQGICLVLAKNGPPTLEDKRAATDFISAITNPETTKPFDVFPFLISRCRTSMNKRITQLHESISKFITSDLDSALLQYTPRSLKEELPRSKTYRKMTYPDQEPSITTMLKDLIHECFRVSDFQLNPDVIDITSAKTLYGCLWAVAEVIWRSRFLTQLIGDLSLLNSERRTRAEKLKRRLAKVCLYTSGIAKLIDAVKRRFPNEKIPHRWVEDSFIGNGEGTYTLCDHTEALWRVFRSQHPLLQQTLTTLDEQFPSLLNNWQQRKTVQTCIHAELRLLLHLSPPWPPSASGYAHFSYEREPKPIGCSKRSCLCCKLWIEEFNLTFRTRWTTSGSSGKPYTNWAFPGAVYSGTSGFNLRSGVDAAVLQGVERQLEDTASRLFPGEKWTPEDDSDDESYDGYDLGHPYPSWRQKVEEIAGDV